MTKPSEMELGKLLDPDTYRVGERAEEMARRLQPLGERHHRANVDCGCGLDGCMRARDVCAACSLPWPCPDAVILNGKTRANCGNPECSMVVSAGTYCCAACAKEVEGE